ncbi:MAG: ribonuclease P protein component, partial [Aestuariivirgaceae bacterium]
MDAGLFSDGVSVAARVFQPNHLGRHAKPTFDGGPATPGLAGFDMNSTMDRLRRRRDFLKAANAPVWKTRSVIVQARQRGDQEPPRIGFTVTKKLGNAVTRNRIRRRLREAVRLTPQQRFAPGSD